MIRKLNLCDKELYVGLAEEFYCSAAVTHNIPLKSIQDTFDELMADDRYLEGYIIECDGVAAGYSLLAKTFSQEAGGIVLWVEEIYVLPTFQGKGLGSEFFKFLSSRASNGIARLRLEVEPDNNSAIKLYSRLGFSPLEYKQMVKEYNQ